MIYFTFAQNRIVSKSVSLRQIHQSKIIDQK